MSDCVFCIECNEEVRPLQHAVTCDICFPKPIHFLIYMGKRKATTETGSLVSGSQTKKKTLSSEDDTQPSPKTTKAKKTSKAQSPASSSTQSASTSAAASSINGNNETKKKTYPKEIDPSSNKESVEPLDFASFPGTQPVQNKKGQYVFDDRPDFRPNLSPQEVIQAGSFGGTYYRNIHSSVTGKSYTGVCKELPTDWVKGLTIAKQVTSQNYDVNVNTYGVKCGGSLEMWETSNWIHKQDPYGWFQWYCRFYLGRRTADDDRQVGRWLRCAGDTGRWRGNLISKCVRSGCGYDNAGVSPVVRQTLQHWGYKLNKDDFDAGVKKMKKKGTA